MSVISRVRSRSGAEITTRISSSSSISRSSPGGWKSGFINLKSGNIKYYYTEKYISREKGGDKIDRPNLFLGKDCLWRQGIHFSDLLRKWLSFALDEVQLSVWWHAIIRWEGLSFPHKPEICSYFRFRINLPVESNAQRSVILRRLSKKIAKSHFVLGQRSGI